jgi:hypothetical protein
MQAFNAVDVQKNATHSSNASLLAILSNLLGSEQLQTKE